MKIKIVNPLEPQRKTLFNMAVGEVGVRDDDGAIFYRTVDTATCLTTPELTYPRVCDIVTDLVTILPPGTVLELTL